MMQPQKWAVLVFFESDDAYGLGRKIGDTGIRITAQDGKAMLTRHVRGWRKRDLDERIAWLDLGLTQIEGQHLAAQPTASTAQHKRVLSEEDAMSIRLQQMHPALVHLPIALLPLAVGADLLGCMTGNKSLLSFGQKAICVAATGAVASAVTGLIAGEEVNVKGASQDMLMTHRNLNFVATVVASGMALWRAGHRRPNAIYLGTGAAGVGVLAYTAYLGGKLVYDVGVGVEPAHGVYRADAPALKAGQVGAFVKTAGTDLVHGVQHMIEELRAGDFVPTITAWYKKRHAPASRQISSAT